MILQVYFGTSDVRMYLASTFSSLIVHIFEFWHQNLLQLIYDFGGKFQICIREIEVIGDEKTIGNNDFNPKVFHIFL